MCSHLQVIFGYCRYHGAPIEAGEAFLLELHGEWGALTTSVPRAAQKVWTSFKKFKTAFGAGGTEFCSLWSDVIRRDQPSLAGASAVIARALNQNLVSRPAAGQDRAAALGPEAFPPQPCCWRGGSFGLPPPAAGSAVVPAPPAGEAVTSPSRLREFFDARAADGKPYRCKQFLSTSFSEAKADEFILISYTANASAELVKWKVLKNPHALTLVVCVCVYVCGGGSVGEVRWCVCGCVCVCAIKYHDTW
jgi:hypothetical protein